MIGFLAIAGFFLWDKHKAHMLGALPYVLLLLCPLMHLFRGGGMEGMVMELTSTKIITKPATF